VCLFPRIIHSPKDALFSFYFLQLCCTLKVPNFNLLQTLSVLLKTVLPVIHCCTEAEAESLGIFFAQIFGQLNHWSIRVNWQKECAQNSCFSRSFQKDEIISFEDFTEKVALTFGKRFAVQLMQCIESSENTYMKARCSLLVLNTV
jgi:hypothetical protein